MLSLVIKRDGRVVPFDELRIRTAIYMSVNNTKVSNGDKLDIINAIYAKVSEKLVKYSKDNIPEISVETIQDIVINSMKELNYIKIADDYTAYRKERNRIRNLKSDLMKNIHEVANTSSADSDSKRENANINGDTAMGTMLKFGTTASKEYYLSEVIPQHISKAHRDGYIHIHDLDFYGLTTTCTQIDIEKLLKKGFSTGHGHLRTPNGITTASALDCIAIQSNQNDQHGGQSIPTFDYGLAPYVKKSFIANICKYLDMNCATEEEIQQIKQLLTEYSESHISLIDTDGLNYATKIINDIIGNNKYVVPERCVTKALKYTDKETYQAMEALIHNLNTMNSRAGSQTPFSSINFGTDTTAEGRMVIKNVLLAQEAGLGNGETAIFPITIFKVKEGVNYNPTDPNYDLFKLACKVSAKRLFPKYNIGAV